jgi:hypothetical protein
MSLFIAIPSYGGLIHASFAQSLMNLCVLLSKNEIQHIVEFLGSDSLISRARNTLIAKFYSQSEYSHLLFLDCDLIFNPMAILKMMKENKELIGCPYPKKIYNWEKVKSCLNEKKSLDELKALFTDINYNLLCKNNQIKAENSLVLAKDIPTGMMLIKRSLISTLMNAYPERKYKNNIAGLSDQAKEFYYDFFATGVVNGTYLSEDYYFCHLVRELGIDCWLETAFTTGHIGREIFYGNLALQINHFKNDDMNLDRKLLMNK